MMSANVSGESGGLNEAADALGHDGQLQKETPPLAPGSARFSPSGALLAHLARTEEPCLILDWHGHVWEANEAARTLLKLSADELDDAGLLTRVPPDQRDLVLTHVRKAVVGGATEVWAGRVAVAGKPLPLELSFQPIVTRAGVADWALAILRRQSLPTRAKAGKKKKKSAETDGQTPEARLLTLEKSETMLLQRLEEQRRRILELEEELGVRRQTEDRLVTRIHNVEKQITRRVEEQRQTSADLAAVARFSTVVLQSRLQMVDETIRAAAAVLDNHSLPDSVRRMLQEAQAHIAAQNRLLTSLAHFAAAARQPVVLEQINMTALFRATAESLQEQIATAGCTVCIGDLLPCRGDRALLQAVAFHLLSNAIRLGSSCPSPVVEVSSSYEEKQDGPGKVREAVWTVRDSGTGFPPNHAYRMFTPMGLAGRLPKVSSSETGLELATVRRVVQRLGGRVWAESHDGRGASFSFTVGKPERVSAGGPAAENVS